MTSPRPPCEDAPATGSEDASENASATSGEDASELARVFMQTMEHADFPRRLGRVIWLGLVLLIITLPFGFFYLHERPDSPVSFESNALTKITEFSASSNKPAGTLNLKLATLLLDVQSVATASNAIEWLRISLDVNQNVCPRLSRAMSLTCGASGTAVVARSTTLTWPQAELLTADSQELQLIRVQPAATEELATGVAIASHPGITIYANCTGRSSLISFSDDTSNKSYEAKENCSLEPSHRLVLQFPMHPAASQEQAAQLPLALSGLSLFSLVASGESASLTGGPADVTVGSTVTPIFPDETNKLVVHGRGLDGVSVSFSGLTQSASLTVAARAATHASLNSDQLIPTRFHRQRDVWLGLALALFGLFLGSLFDVVPRSWLPRGCRPRKE
jgi:hypothetical protein